MTSNENQANLSKYNMNHDKRGIALVININNYDPNLFKLEERKWSKRDLENLTKTLNYLEFDLDLGENLTKSQIIERLHKIASINHEHFDCFLCVVMSHGNEEKIVTSDSKLISFEEIMEPIKACPTLLNKPKMFFFQACRGEKRMESRPNSASSTKSSRGAQISDHIEITKSNENKNKALKFENESDLLIFYSTLPNRLSLSVDEKEGTIFIKSVCDVFIDAYKHLPNNMSLAQMYTKINESVSKTGLQISELAIYRMSKEIYFLPKNVSHSLFFLNRVYMNCIKLRVNHSFIL